MMLYPAMSKLTARIPNRYMLVDVVARRARQIADEAEQADIHLDEKSVTLAIHEVALELFDQRGLEEQLRYEHRHRDILLRFGRYPHRNAILGRPSTPEELAFLEQPGSSF